MTLLQQLEAAGEGSRELDAAIADVFDPLDALEMTDGYPGRWPFVDGSPFSDRTPPVTTSLDAALALAERCGLDGWNTLYAALMSWKAHDPRGSLSTTLPLALCAAILRAKQ